MDVHEAVLQHMEQLREKFAAQGISLRLPPPSVEVLGTRYVEMDYRKMLAAEFRFDERFSNPIGSFQGGFLCAAFDEVYGPLTYIAAQRPVITIEMSTTFLRPFTERTGVMIINAEVVSRGKTLLVLKAEARSGEGKLIATSTNHSLIVADESLGR
jgi:uncharacterized protein (TIGR00369 family)